MKHIMKLQTSEFIEIYKKFCAYIGARALKNPRLYSTIVTEFMVWLEQRGISHMKQVKQIELQEYYTYIIQRPNTRKAGTLSDSTIKNHLLVLNILFQYLLDSGFLKRIYVTPRYKIKDQKERSVLTKEEIKQLYAVCANELETVLLHICYGCGLRRSEAYMLNVKDIQFSQGIVIVCKGKWNKRREVPMSKKIQEDIKDYVVRIRPLLLKEQICIEQAFFVHTNGMRMSKNMLNKTLQEIVERSQQQQIIEKHITLHCLRHSIATHLIENNAGFEEIQKFLGHSCIDTTQLYAIRRKKRINLT